MKKKSCFYDNYFNFEIIKFQFQTIKIKILTPRKKITFSDNYFDFFIEDLIVFLEQNMFQKRWDYQKIILENLAILNLNAQNLTKFISNFKSVTNFDLTTYENY